VLLLRKRRWVLLVVTLAVAGAVVAGLAALSVVGSRESSLKASYERIRPGMTSAEVDAIMGRGPDDEPYGVNPDDPADRSATLIWRDVGADVVVWVGPDGAVADKRFDERHTPHRPSMWRTLFGR
jgi:hypothetical protein